MVPSSTMSPAMTEMDAVSASNGASVVVGKVGWVEKVG